MTKKILLETISNYQSTKIKWVRNEDGTIVLTVRYGNKLIEFKKGENAIKLSSKAELVLTLQSIKKAVDNGEFDRLLEEQLAYGSRLTKINWANEPYSLFNRLWAEIRTEKVPHNV